VLAVRPYGFLDDAPLEERRTQAVYARRTAEPKDSEALGALDPEAIAAVRAEAWPDPRDAEELHEALLWMGFVTTEEAAAWPEWIEELARAGRIVREGARWFAREATRDPQQVLRGRMEALGPVHADDEGLSGGEGQVVPLLHALEAAGVVLRLALDGREAWCDRRLLARIRRYTLDKLRREIEPVSTADLLRFLAAWQHLAEPQRLEGPAGVLEVVRQLAGFEAPALAWERRILAPRVRGYRHEWLDELCLSGRVAWGRLWSGGRSAPRVTPISFFPRDELDLWLALAPHADDAELTWPGRAALDALVRRGALFQHELAKVAAQLPSDAERGLIELVGLGLATSDSFASFRALLLPAHRRREPLLGAGRWSTLRMLRSAEDELEAPRPSSVEVTSTLDRAESVARILLRRYGVIFRTLLARERQPMPWRDLARACRTLELRGDIRGGRFVAGHSGEQFALPEAITLLRRVRREEQELALPHDFVIPGRELLPGAAPVSGVG
jgi:ATP-dependent Lhr-like helicase